MWNRIALLFTLLLWLPLASAVPQCSDVFTKPPTGPNNPGMQPPADLPSKSGNFICNTRGKNSFCNRGDAFSPGDFNFASGSFDKGSYISTHGASTRLYFDSLTLKNSDINIGGNAADLIVYVRGNLYINGHNTFNGILYVEGSIVMSGNATVIGAVAVQGSVPSGGNFTPIIDLGVLGDADFGGMCEPGGTTGIDHFLLRYSDSPLTCKAEPVAVYACKDASCSTVETSSIVAELFANNAVNGWEGGNLVSLSNGVAIKNLWHTLAASPITIGVASASVAVANPTQCQRGSGAASAAACTLSFADSGLLFDVPDKLAGKPVTVSISAVRTDLQSQKCVPTFQSTAKNVLFWSDFLNPASVTGAPRISVNSGDIGTSLSTAAAVTLNFDATGSASLNLNYPDAGRVALNARYLGNASEGNLQLDGSDSFVSFPAGLCIKPQDDTAVCTAGDASCNVYKKAGEAFNLNISAHAWMSDNDSDYCDNTQTTPNFAMPDLPLIHQLVAPVPGVQGNVGRTQYNHQPQSGANQVTQSVSEVGVFRFGTGAVGSYLGSTAFTIPIAWSAPLGRFVPATFAVKDVSLIPGCGGFSYMDQPTPLAMTIEAHNLGAVVTQNYQGSFAKGTAVLLGEHYDDGHDLSGRLSALGGAWEAGVMGFDIDNQFQFARTAAPDADGPFELLDIGLRVDDNDSNNTQISPRDMKPDTAGDCSLTNSCSGQRLGTIKMRHGRLVLENTYGPENEILRMTARTQIWQGSGWGLSVDDSCTLVNPALPAPQMDDSALGYVFEPDLSAGQSIVRSATPARFSAGMLDLYWQALGSPLYRGQVSAPLNTPDWLKWYWNWDNSSPNGLFDPRSSAYFGRFRGDDRVIFWREVH
ncbi:DUF6701 domain-containing protein [Shewanella sp.]|uniref:DUF6701 domain-containing protein n=1 Tax=Shewanella sp. TaxID=50422 RepID=UPI0035648F07